MIFTVEETNLMCIYGIDSRRALIVELKEMQKELQADEIELKDLTEAVLVKIKAMSDTEFDKVKHELVADFE